MKKGQGKRSEENPLSLLGKPPLKLENRVLEVYMAKNGESFSTHILLGEKKEKSRRFPLGATFEKLAITNFQERSLTGGSKS